MKYIYKKLTQKVIKEKNWILKEKKEKRYKPPRLTCQAHGR